MQTHILERHPDAPIRVYAIVFEVVSSDRGAKHSVLPRDLLDEPRVTLFWDDRRIAGRWFDENVTRLGERNGEAGRIEWDAFVLYGHEEDWGTRERQHLIWGRPIHQEGPRLLQAIDGMLERMTADDP